VGALEIVGRAAVCTTLAGASGGVAALFIAKYRTDCWDVAAVCNGVLAGLVSITAGCSVVEPAAGILAGCVGALIFDLGCSLLLKMQVQPTHPLSTTLIVEDRAAVSMDHHAVV
jgi:Amt family ammonium transporter